MGLVDELLDGMRSGAIHDKLTLNRAKLEGARRHHSPKVLSDADILAAVPASERQQFRPLLQTKGTRTLSGVAIVAVQSSPEWCPHGTCTFCPGGPPSHSAKSYTGFEPAALRAGRNNFDPYLQVADRVQQLKAIGHDTDKIDLILMGGTFPARDLDYQQWFVKRCYDAMNDDGTPSLSRFGAPGALTLDDAMLRNEAAANRCIGLTVETKPDWCKEPHLDVALGFGATRIELGVQTTYDDALARTHRGHTVADGIEATRLVKDAGLKLVYHMMLGLPGCDPARDEAAFRRIFADPDFRPDMLKIYPTLVVPGTQLHEEWKRGEYEPYDTARAALVTAAAKRLVPPYVRIQRVDRDIPTTMVSAGVDKSNLRELALEELARTGDRCRCIRCREVGIREREGVTVGEPVLTRLDYEASGGRETFLAFEDTATDTVHAYLRLRRPGAAWRPELQGSHMMVRELKVHGRMVALGRHDGEAAQHQGRGRTLMDEAARIAFDEEAVERLCVLAGPGVKPYYRRLGFVDDGVYLALSRSTWRRPTS